ncbi:DUF4430 domain-containing protein [Aneurinibacillus sp. BA2021]|nr:DUF4430 domain-containing protein [Aneurinibacillus sp. BA2021]
MMKRFKQTMMALSLAISIVVMLASSAFAATTVNYKILSVKEGDTGVLYDGPVTVSDGSTVFAALKKISDDSSGSLKPITLTYSGSGAGLYVSAINGASDKKYPSAYYAGWMYRVNNDLLSYSADDPTGAVLHNGDDVTWYYASPAQTYFTKINSTAVNGSTLTANVTAEKFEDVINWDLSGFDNLAGATVVAEKGGVKQTATTDSNGNAVFTGLGSGTWKVWVQDKYYTSGDLTDAIEHTKSSVSTVTIP